MIDQEKLRSIRVLFEDRDLLAVSKPAGMSVHGGAGEKGPTLIDLLRQAYAEPTDLHLAHRLDRPTSGIVLLAKSTPVLKAVQSAWDAAKKTYLAVALGTIAEAFTIDDAIKDKEGRARPAKTEVAPIARLGGVAPTSTLITCGIATGRTHQIRLHLAGRKHPVLMDDQHGDFAQNKAWARAVQAKGAPKPKYLMLHALRLEVRHPTDARKVRLSAEPPAAWSKVLSAAGAAVDVFEQVL